jgi:hypothetical protein
MYWGDEGFVGCEADVKGGIFNAFSLFFLLFAVAFYFGI